MELDDVEKVYDSVIDDVIENLKENSHEEGIEDDILEELRSIWKSKLKGNANQRNRFINVANTSEERMRNINNLCNEFIERHQHYLPVEVTVPMESSGVLTRTLKVQVPVHCIRGDNLHSLFEGPIISATIGLSDRLATTLLQQHINTATSACYQLPNSRILFPEVITLDGNNDSSDESEEYDSKLGSNFEQNLLNNCYDCSKNSNVSRRPEAQNLLKKCCAPSCFPRDKNFSIGVNRLPPLDSTGYTLQPQRLPEVERILETDLGLLGLQTNNKNRSSPTMNVSERRENFEEKIDQLLSSSNDFIAEYLESWNSSSFSDFTDLKSFDVEDIKNVKNLINFQLCNESAGLENRIGNLDEVLTQFGDGYDESFARDLQNYGKSEERKELEKKVKSSLTKPRNYPKYLSFDGPDDSPDENESVHSENDDQSDQDSSNNDNNQDEISIEDELVIVSEDDALNSADDISEEEPDLYDTENIILCQFEKVVRSQNRWRIILKNGIMNLTGKDFVFQKVIGDTWW